MSWRLTQPTAPAPSSNAQQLPRESSTPWRSYEPAPGHASSTLSGLHGSSTRQNGLGAPTTGIDLRLNDSHVTHSPALEDTSLADATAIITTTIEAATRMRILCEHKDRITRGRSLLW